MYRVTPNRAIAFMVFGVVAYTALMVISDPIVIREIFNHLSMGVTLLVAITWGPPAFKTLRYGGDANAGEWMIVVAIFLSATVLCFNRMLAILSFYLDRPMWLIDGPIIAFVPYSITIVFSLFLIAPGFVPKPRTNPLWHLGMAGLIGGLFAGFFLGKAI